MSEKVKHLKAALQLAEMHLAANPTDYNQEKVESALAEYEMALSLELIVVEALAEIDQQPTGQVITRASDQERIQELEASLAEAKRLLNEQQIEKDEKTEEAQKSALSGEVPQYPAPAAPVAPAIPVAAPAAPAKPAAAAKAAPAKAVAKPAAPAPEAEVKKN